MREHLREICPLLAALAFVVAGCAIPDPVETREEAVAIAIRVSGLSEPITVDAVREGVAGGVVPWIVPGSWAAEQLPDERAGKVGRRAWGVELLGMGVHDCKGEQECPLERIRVGVVIDRETGEVYNNHTTGG